jgi:LysM repeat protein
MKVSKVVLIVVALHVLVIGGIIVFEGCSRVKSNTPDMAGNESLPGQQPDMASGAASNEVASIPNPQGPGAASSLTPANSMAGNEAPAPAPAPAVASAMPTPTSSAQSYVVKKGDSLWKIAKAENLTVGELARANNLTKTSTIKVGQKLKVPAATTEKANVAMASVIPTSTDAGSAVSASTAGATGTDANGALYTVKSGDSLWKIARQQSVTVAALRQANSLTGDSLKVGQKLHIPVATAKTATGAASGAASAGVAATTSAGWQAPGTYSENGQTIHVVDFNETPATIAKKYNITVDDLTKANNITDVRKVQYGQRLVIPTAQQNTVASATTPAANTTTVTPTAPATPALAAPVVSASPATVQ